LPHKEKKLALLRQYYRAFQLVKPHNMVDWRYYPITEWIILGEHIVNNIATFWGMKVFAYILQHLGRGMSYPFVWDDAQ
jgi:hypothetical protein